MSNGYGYEPIPRADRFKIPAEKDGFKYVIAELPGPDDEGSSAYDQLDNMGYEEAGRISRRKVAMRIPEAEAERIEKEAQEKSRRIANLPPVPVDDRGRPLPGVIENPVEDQLPVDAVEFLNTPEP